MTLLTTVQAAAEELGIRSPTAVAGSNNATSARLWRIARRAARDVLKSHDWSRLIKTATISADGSTTYSLPSDFDRMVSDTMWNTTDNWRIRGHVYPSRWQARTESYVVSTASSAAFRLTVSGGTRKIEIDPAPDSGDSITYAYVSRAMFDSGSGLEAEWTNDGWSSLLDEQLITDGMVYRFLRSVGRDFASSEREYQINLRREISQEVSPPILVLGTSDPFILTSTVEETGFGA